MQWALLSQQWKDEARWMTKGREWGSGLGPSWVGGWGGGLGGAWKLTGGGAAQRNVFIHRIVSLMISLLACTQTYKNNTALIWHRVIITVWQTFRKNQIQANLMEHHSGKSPVPSRLKWSKTRNTTWSKGVSTCLPSHPCTPIRPPAPYVINVMTLVHRAAAQPCNLVFSRHVTMILPSNVLFPLSNKTGRQHFRKESAPRYHHHHHHHQRWYIYPLCIYTYTQSQRYTHLCRKNTVFFPQSNTH